MIDTIKDLDSILDTVDKISKKTKSQYGKYTTQINYYVSEYTKVNNTLKKMNAIMGGNSLYEFLAKSDSLKDLSISLGLIKSYCNAYPGGFNDDKVAKTIGKRLEENFKVFDSEIDRIQKIYESNEGKKTSDLQAEYNSSGKNLEAQQLDHEIDNMPEVPTLSNRLPSDSAISSVSEDCKDLLDCYKTFKDPNKSGFFDKILLGMLHHLKKYAKNDVSKAKVKYGIFTRFGDLRRNTHFHHSIVIIQNIIAGKDNKIRNTDINGSKNNEDDKDKKTHKIAKHSKNSKSPKVPEETRKVFREYCLKAYEILTLMSVFNIENSGINTKLDKLFHSTFYPIFKNLDELAKTVKVEESERDKVTKRMKDFRNKWSDLINKTEGHITLYFYFEQCDNYFDNYQVILRRTKYFGVYLSDCKNLEHETTAILQKIDKVIPKIEKKLASAGPLTKKLANWDENMKNLNSIKRKLPKVKAANKQLSTAMSLYVDSLAYAKFGKKVSNIAKDLRDKFHSIVPLSQEICDIGIYDSGELKDLEEKVDNILKAMKATSADVRKNLSTEETLPPFYPKDDRYFSKKNLKASYVLCNGIYLVPERLSYCVNDNASLEEFNKQKETSIDKLMDTRNRFIENQDKLDKYRNDLNDMKEYDYGEFLDKAKTTLFILSGMFFAFLSPV